MRQNRPPWTDAALLVLSGDLDTREIVAEGTLRQMVERIAATPATEWPRFSLSLPDRSAVPLAYRATEFGRLIRELAS